MSILMFSQTLFGAMCLTFAHVVFSSGLESSLSKYAPNVNPVAIINAGATGIRDVASDQDLTGVTKAYADGVDHVFYMGVALGICCVITCSGMGWKDVRKKKPSTAQV